MRAKNAWELWSHTCEAWPEVEVLAWSQCSVWQVEVLRQRLQALQALWGAGPVGCRLCGVQAVWGAGCVGCRLCGVQALWGPGPGGSTG